MRKLNQKGFGLIEGLLILIVILLVGFIGYYVYNAQQTSNEDQEIAAKSTITTKDKSAKVASSGSDETALKAFLLETCSSADSSAINAVFKNQATQNVETDSMYLEGKYAVVNVKCTLSNGTELSTLFLKNSSDNWELLVKEPVGISCEFLTGAGFPDALKAPYCQNP